MRGSIFFPEGWGLLGGGVQGIFGYLSFPGVGSEAYFRSFYCVNFEFGNSEIWILENWIFQGGGGQDPPNPSRSAHVYFKCKQYLFLCQTWLFIQNPSHTWWIAFEKLSFFANYIWRTVKYFNSSPSKFYRNFIMFKDTLEANILAILSIVRVKSFLCNCFYIMITIYPYSCLIQLFFF